MSEPLPNETPLFGGDIHDESPGTERPCRICEVDYASELLQQSQAHRDYHQAILRGGLPKEIRELLKAVGWALAHNDQGLDRLRDAWSDGNGITLDMREIGKRAVVFGMWCRARENGLSDEEFEAYMYDHLAFVDRLIEERSTTTTQSVSSIRKWEQYGG